MEMLINGNCIRLLLSKSENNITFRLPDGYSYETFQLTGSSNLNYVNPLCKANIGSVYNFPPVRSKSPSTITLLKENASAESSAVITIFKFGQIPDPHYFDKAFEPILVTGDDGNKYKVIPSDQFK